MSDREPPTTQSQIAELKVSGHTMALDPGLYCVFSAPGSVAPAPDSGLPTVRISAAPGVMPGRVEMVGLNPGGDIGPDSATLLRVAEARSTVLVTVYQAKDTRAEAPQIQVVRISGDAQVPAVPDVVAQTSAPGLPPPARTPREVHVVAHIYGRGDVGGEIGEWMGEPGSKRWIEGFAVAPAGDVPARDVEYQAVLGRGWLSPWSESGEFCGSRSMSLPILGLRVRLRGASAGTHRVVLSATFIDGSKVGPVGDAEPCEAPSLAALEAFHLAFERAGAVANQPKPPSGRRSAAKPAPAAEMTAVKSPATRHSATKPATGKPAMAKPGATKLDATKLDATKPGVTKLGVTKPVPAKLDAAKGARQPEPDALPTPLLKGRVAKVESKTTLASPPMPAPVAITPAKPRPVRKPAPTRRR